MNMWCRKPYTFPLVRSQLWQIGIILELISEKNTSRIYSKYLPWKHLWSRRRTDIFLKKNCHLSFKTSRQLSMVSIQTTVTSTHSWMVSTPRVRTLLTMEESRKHTTPIWSGLNVITWSLAYLVLTSHHARCSGCRQHRPGAPNIESRLCANESRLVCILSDSSVS